MVIDMAGWLAGGLVDLLGLSVGMGGIERCFHHVLHLAGGGWLPLLLGLGASLFRRPLASSEFLVNAFLSNEMAGWMNT